MSELEKLCFILTCRDAANKVRQQAYQRYYKVERTFRGNSASLYKGRYIKNHNITGLTEKMLTLQQEYRKIADHMSAQKPILRAALKAAGYRATYNAGNKVCFIESISENDAKFKRYNKILRTAPLKRSHTMSVELNELSTFIYNNEEKECERYTDLQIKEIAAGYTFDKVVLVDGILPVNPYELK